jgi:glycosyltransferase involved in cell wall biosynthesis
VPDLSSEDVLFIGREKATSSWYRCVLPANALGCDWITIQPDLSTFTGINGRPRWEDYDLIVCQLAVEEHYIKEIKRIRKHGRKILYDIDDYVFGTGAAKHHVHAKDFAKKKTQDAYKRAMSACDGIICSTPFLAEKYKEYGPTWVCRNGIDLQRYQYTRMPHNEFRFGWAGAPGVGHREAMEPWMDAIRMVLQEIPNSRFYSVGEPFALDLKPEFGNRAVAIPWVLLEVFPMTLLNFDVGLAPALDTDFWRGKSDLRWLEYSAMGVATVGNPSLYTELDDFTTGSTATSPEDAYEAIKEFANYPSWHRKLAQGAQNLVTTEYNHKVTGLDWIKPFEEVMG